MKDVSSKKISAEEASEVKFGVNEMTGKEEPEMLKDFDFWNKDITSVSEVPGENVTISNNNEEEKNMTGMVEKMREHYREKENVVLAGLVLLTVALLFFTLVFDGKSYDKQNGWYVTTKRAFEQSQNDDLMVYQGEGKFARDSDYLYFLMEAKMLIRESISEKMPIDDSTVSFGYKNGYGLVTFNWKSGDSYFYKTYEVRPLQATGISPYPQLELHSSFIDEVAVGYRAPG